MRIEQLDQSLNRLRETFVDKQTGKVPAMEMKHKSRSTDLQEIVMNINGNLPVQEDDYLNFLNQDSIFIVSSPITETRIGLYEGILCGYSRYSYEIDIVYINIDGEVFTDRLSKDPNVFYKWDIVFLEKSKESV